MSASRAMSSSFARSSSRVSSHSLASERVAEANSAIVFWSNVSLASITVCACSARLSWRS